MKEKIKGKQYLLMFLCWALYTFIYLGRYSYSSNIEVIGNHFTISKAQTGLVSSCFFFAYGIGQVVNGMLCKYYNKKYVLGGAVIISAVVNLLIFIGVPFTFYPILWLVNGFIQSVAWPSLMLVLADHLYEENLKPGLVVMGTTSCIGILVTYGISALLNRIASWKFSFLVAFIGLIIVAMLWLILYNKATGEKQVKNVEVSKEVQVQPKTKNKIAFALLMSIIGLAVYAVIQALIKEGLNTWVPDILVDNFSLPSSFSILLTLVLPIFGMFGNFFVLFLNRKIKDFLSISAICMILTVILTAVVMLFIKSQLIIVLVAFGLISCLTHGITAVITNIAPLVLRRSINSGRLSGVLNGFCYLGATISSYGLGLVADNFGWNSVFILFLALGVFAILFWLIYLLVLYFAKKKKTI